MGGCFDLFAVLFKIVFWEREFKSRPMWRMDDTSGGEKFGLVLEHHALWWKRFFFFGEFWLWSEKKKGRGINQKKTRGIRPGVLSKRVFEKHL